MRKINAYVVECLPENVGVIIDDYPNQDNNSELAINLDLGDCLLNFFREIKEDEVIITMLNKNERLWETFHLNLNEEEV